MAGSRRPTQLDIARLAGVSRPTVSLVMSGNAARIRAELRERVLAAAEHLGYAANPAARSLAGGHNRLIGVYTFERLFPVQHRDFYYPFLLGIEEESEAASYDLLLFTSAADPSGRRSINHGGVNRLRLADGCVLLGLHVDGEQLVRLARDRTPFVFLGRREVPGIELSYVGADYAAATVEVIDQLSRLGHLRIAYFEQPDAPVGALTERLDAYRTELKRIGHYDGSLVYRLGPEEITGEFAHSLFQRGVTAFLAEDAPIARRIMQVAGELGRQAPRDFSLAMLGDYADDEEVRWTTYHIPRQEMGRQAVRLLVALLGDDEPRQLMLPCPFVPGQTTGPVPAGNR